MTAKANITTESSPAKLQANRDENDNQHVLRVFQIMNGEIKEGPLFFKGGGTLPTNDFHLICLHLVR